MIPLYQDPCFTFRFSFAAMRLNCLTIMTAKPRAIIGNPSTIKHPSSDSMRCCNRRNRKTSGLVTNEHQPKNMAPYARDRVPEQLYLEQQVQPSLQLESQPAGFSLQPPSQLVERLHRSLKLVLGRLDSRAGLAVIQVRTNRNDGIPIRMSHRMAWA